MARRPQVRYYPSRGAYYTQIRGVKHRLAEGEEDFPDGPTYKKAQEAYWKLLEDDSLGVAGDTNTVRVLCDAYLTAMKPGWRPATLQIRKHLLLPFVEMFGKTQARHVTSFTLDKVVEQMREPRKVRGRLVTWSASTASLFKRTAKSVFRWAAEEELIPRNTLRKVKVPDCRTRARERTVTQEEHSAILATVRSAKSAALRRLIIALENTAARPGELANAHVRDWNDSLGAIVYFADDKRRDHEFAHKTSGKGKDRVIYFTGEALAMVRELVSAKKAADLIFPTWKGKRYTRHAMDSCFRGIRERTGISRVVPYSYRHTFATRWLEAKKSIEMLAEIMGNTVATIRKHYSHLCKSHDLLRAELEAFRRSDVG